MTSKLNSSSRVTTGDSAITGIPENHVPEFSLLETILWESCCGYWLLPGHLERLRLSATYFAWQYDENHLIERLENIVKDLEPAPHQINVSIDREGTVNIQTKLANIDRSPVRARLATRSIDSSNIFFYHYTSYRQNYDEAVIGVADCDEVILWNSKGEVTESCTSNLVVELQGKYYTPPVSCGLLPGTYRGSLLREGNVEERIITIDQLKTCSKIYLINSLVGWREVELMPQGTDHHRA